MPESDEYAAAQGALDNANRYFEMVDNVYPKALELSYTFGKLALGFAELLPVTTRHIAILDGISHGMTKEQALATVGVKSFKTAEITEALGVKTINQAIIKAYELGMLPPYKNEIQTGEIRKTLTEIWAKLTAGLSREEIAEARNVTVDTISTQLRELYSVIGATNQQHAVRIGLEAGITNASRSSQGQANRALMSASALTAVKLWSIVPVSEYPEDVRYGELPIVALGPLYRGTKNMTYDGKFKKQLDLRRIGEISKERTKIEIVENDQPEQETPKLDEVKVETARQKLAGLTENERNVAIMIAAGFSAPEIRDRLSLTPGTVLTYSSTVRRILGVSRNDGIAQAIGPVNYDEIPQKKADEEPANVAIERRFGKKFMWEEDYERMVTGIIDKLKQAGATPDGVYSVKDVTILSKMLNEGLADESEVESGLLPLNKLVQALLLKTSEGKRIRSGFEGRHRALRTIEELIATRKWE